MNSIIQKQNTLESEPNVPLRVWYFQKLAIQRSLCEYEGKYQRCHESAQKEMLHPGAFFVQLCQKRKMSPVEIVSFCCKLPFCNLYFLDAVAKALAPSLDEETLRRVRRYGDLSCQIKLHYREYQNQSGFATA